MESSRIIDDAISGAEIFTQYMINPYSIGYGGYGTVYSIEECKTCIFYACKKIRKCDINDEIEKDYVKNEVGIMRDLPRNPNIILLKDVYEDDLNVYIITELCQGGELFDRIVAKGYYREREAATLFKSLVQAVNFCHENGVIHRDLKPDNILFLDKTEHSEIKLIDFGLATTFKPGQNITGFAGTLSYMAPEIIEGSSYGPKVDIWSLGVILYNLLSGRPPFNGKGEALSLNILKEKIKFEENPWPNVSDAAKDLIEKILNRDPEQRLDAMEILAHPWFRIVP